MGGFFAGFRPAVRGHARDRQGRFGADVRGGRAGGPTEGPPGGQRVDHCLPQHDVTGEVRMLRIVQQRVVDQPIATEPGDSGRPVDVDGFLPPSDLGEERQEVAGTAQRESVEVACARQLGTGLGRPASGAK